MNEVRYRRQLAMHFYEKETSMPHALCPMPYAPSLLFVICYLLFVIC
ncbi:MAG: hypothetical protein WBL95_11620 [Microcoleus sp.]